MVSSGIEIMDILQWRVSLWLIGMDPWLIEDLLIASVLVGGNIISWRSKKQSVVTWSSGKLEYQTVA